MGSNTNTNDIVGPASSGSAGTEYVQDAAAPANPTAPAISLIRDDALATATPAEGDWVTGKANARAAMWVALDDTVPPAINQADLVSSADNVEIRTAAGVALNLDSAGDVQVDIKTIASGDNNIGNVDIVTLPALPAGTNNIGDVDVLSSALPTGASTLAEQQSQTTALQLIDNAISGAGFNITQFAGTNNVVGSGNATGALRVELPTNGTGVIAGVTTVTTVTTVSTVTNLSQMGGVAITLNKGASGTGTQRVSIANDSMTAATSTLTSPAGSTSSFTIVSANTARLGCAIFNGTSTLCYVKFGTTASATDYTLILPSNGYYEVPFMYNGRIDGLSLTGVSGDIYVTEITA